jgi:hypothetical protein
MRRKAIRLIALFNATLAVRLRTPVVWAVGQAFVGLRAIAVIASGRLPLTHMQRAEVGWKQVIAPWPMAVTLSTIGRLALMFVAEALEIYPLAAVVVHTLGVGFAKRPR